MRRIKSFIFSWLKSMGYIIVGFDQFKEMETLAQTGRSVEIYKFAVGVNSDLDSNKYFDVIGLSKAQRLQDIFALAAAGFQSDGFFVEFGATNGVSLSNSWLLEKNFNWKGILAEPAASWHKELRKNRGCDISTKLVYSSSGLKIDFLEADIAEYSTIQSFRDADSNVRRGTVYKVETISLVDLLLEHKAPRVIDFLSIDTEGSEFEILQAFDFEKFHFKAICVEHNFSSTRQQIKKLLEANDYEQVLNQVSGLDDWYVSKTLL